MNRRLMPWVLVSAAALSLTAAPTPVLTTVRDIRTRAREGARSGQPVELRAVVTTNLDNRKAVVVQDATAAIYVRTTEATRAAAGDLVVVKGVTAAGSFAPMVHASKLILIGRAATNSGTHGSRDSSKNGPHRPFGFVRFPG